MSGETLTELTGEEEKRAAARSRTYELFARLFEYPDQTFGEAIRSGELAETIRQTLDALDPTLLEGADWDALRSAGEGEDALAIEYTRLFDVGQRREYPEIANFYRGYATAERVESRGEIRLQRIRRSGVSVCPVSVLQEPSRAR